jgi:hypothetical protein
MKRKTECRSPEQITENASKTQRINNSSGLESGLSLHSNKMAAMLDMEVPHISQEEIQDQLGPHGDEKSLAMINLILSKQAEQMNSFLYKVHGQHKEAIAEAVALATHTVEKKYNTLLDKYKSLETRVIQMELQSRRNNLIIAGVKEEVGFKYHELKNWFNEFCKTTLGLEGEFLVERIHRLGAPPKKSENHENQRPRPPRLVIVKFTQYQQKMKLWGAVKKLKNTGYFLEDDYPEEIRNTRRSLQPIAAEARNVYKMDATVRIDKLLIDGRTYTIDQLNMLPACLFAAAHSSTWTEDVVGFFRKECPLSNHHPSPFVLDHEAYSCIEEHLLSQEALLFDDRETAHKIRSTDNPVEMLRHRKDMIRNNPKYSREIFEKEAPQILLNGLRAKFLQNDHCKTFLLKTEKRTIVEASPYDRFFGIGYGHRSKEPERNFLLNRDKWGNNALGKGLMTVRDEVS